MVHNAIHNARSANLCALLNTLTMGMLFPCILAAIPMRSPQYDPATNMKHTSYQVITSPMSIRGKQCQDNLENIKLNAQHLKLRLV